MFPCGELDSAPRMKSRPNYDSHADLLSGLELESGLVLGLRASGALTTEPL